MSMNRRGDTIIEVVLSMGLLTSILLIAWGTTNRATQIMAGARDRTYMVNQVKEQAEIIKAEWATNAQYFSGYPNVASGDLDPNPCSGLVSDGDTPRGGQSWYLQVNGTGIERAPTPTKKIDTNKQVWVQMVKSGSGTPVDPNYTDFYIRACWVNNLGSNQKQENTQVIVRVNS